MFKKLFKGMAKNDFESNCLRNSFCETGISNWIGEHVLIICINYVQRDRNSIFSEQLQSDRIIESIVDGLDGLAKEKNSNELFRRLK